MEDNLPGFVDEGDRPSSAQSTRDDVMERRRQLHKQRQKKATTVMVSSSDTRAASARPMSRRMSNDMLPTMAPVEPSLSRTTSTSSRVPQSPATASANPSGFFDDEEDVGALIVPSSTTKPAGPRPSGKIEKILQEEGLEAVYTPSGSTRFDAPPPSPKTKVVQSRTVDAQHAADPLFFQDLEAFVRAPAPKGITVHCQISRDKSGIDKGLYPIYTLKLERPEGDQLRLVFLLAGRKRHKSKTSNYLISTNEADLSRDGDAFAAKLRANFLGTQFTFYDNGFNPFKGEERPADRPLRAELGAVIYETNLLGFKGPRKMTVLIPGVDQSTSMGINIRPESERDSILERHRTERLDDLLVLHNKQPTWNEDSQSYVLNFHGRVTQASVKNFQIIHDSDPDYIIMQFGRTSESNFTMDFQYPMSALQAFSIALSSFDGKLACE